MSDAMNQLNNWLLETVKSGAMDSEGTSHPSAQGDSGTQPAQVGERGSENESDVASQIPAETINEASGTEAEGAGRGENTPVTDIGTKAAPTGEDASVETSSAKETKEDPGTSHPAATDNASVGDGNKYAQVRQLGDSILSDIAVADAAATQAAARTSDSNAKSANGAESDHKDDASKEEDDKSKLPSETKDDKSDDKSKKDDEKKASSDATSTESTSSEAGGADQSKEASAEAIQAAKDAGSQAAEAVAKSAGIDTSAEDKAGMLDSIVKSAQADAKNLVAYMQGYLKEAMPMPPGGEMVDPAAAGGIDPAALAALVGGEAPGGVPPVAPEVVPEGAEAVVPEGAEEVVPEGAEGGAVAPEGAEDEGGLAELAAMLAEAGISPEEVMAMVSAGGEAGGDAVPAEALGEAPGEVPGEAPGGVVGEEISEEEGAKVAKVTKAGKAAFDQLSQTDKKAAVVNAIKKLAGKKQSAE